MRKTKIIGVLALQGAVEPHKAHIEAAGAAFRAVKTRADFAAVDAFILPGGESTTMLKLIKRFDLWDVLADEFSRKPVWGICAGCILIAEKAYKRTSSRQKQRSSDNNQKILDQVRGDNIVIQKSFNLLPITVERNGYGRQLDSHIQDIDGYPVSFIRAPIIESAGEGVEILAHHEGKPAWVKKGNIMASTFHPELTLKFPSPMHRSFIDLVF